MTRKEHLEFCKKCLNRKFDSNQGLICNITGRIAEFNDTCENFNLDETVKEEIQETPLVSTDEKIVVLDTDVIGKLKVHQDFYYAIIGGSLAALISAFIWAVVTFATKYQIGYMAIGVGLLVGFSVRFFGAGIDKRFGYLGAFLSLLGCMLGNLFSQIGFIAQEQSFGYFETLTYLNFGLIIDILAESFNPMDLLFYAIAIYEGYRFSFRKISAQEIKDIQSNTNEGYPLYYKLRKPLAIISIICIGLFFFKIMNGVNGIKTYQYESGKKMSEGELKHSKEQGKWTYWYENGTKQVTCFYSKGLPDSLWQWYDESGNLTKIGHYKKGLEHGIWIHYYQNGIASDSGSYFESRMNGEWKYRYENGNLYQHGFYNRNLQDSIWSTYFENGQLSTQGKMDEGNQIGLWTSYYENGQLANNIVYLPQNKSNIEDAWDPKGNQIVQDGNGLYQLFSNTGQLTQKGEVEHGNKVGTWITYFENGNINEEGVYENDIYHISNYWDINGEQQIKDGEGFYKSFYPDGTNLFETGKMNNGLREGIWKMYYQSSDALFQECNFIQGKRTGLQKIYFESGQIASTGVMKDDCQEGEWKWYYENGKLSSIANYINDKKEGKQTIWSEVGEKTKEEIYKEGRLLQEKLF